MWRGLWRGLLKSPPTRLLFSSPPQEPPPPPLLLLGEDSFTPPPTTTSGRGSPQDVPRGLSQGLLAGMSLRSPGSHASLVKSLGSLNTSQGLKKSRCGSDSSRRPSLGVGVLVERGSGGSGADDEVECVGGGGGGGGAGLLGEEGTGAMWGPCACSLCALRAARPPMSLLQASHQPSGRSGARRGGGAPGVLGLVTTSMIIP